MSKGNVRIPGTDDAEEFAQTIASMKVMGISDDDLHSIFKVISSVLMFGNMEFKQERNTDQAILPDNTVAQKVRQNKSMIWCTARFLRHSSNYK